MDKNNIKKIAAFAGSVVLSGTIAYNVTSGVFKVKPFAQNKYHIYKLNLIEHKKDGVYNETIYGDDGNFDPELLMTSILIKTPFYIDEDGLARRDIYRYDYNQLSFEEIKFIIDNIEDQELLLSKDSIKNIVGLKDNNYDDFYNNKYFTLFDYEKVSGIPYNNDFEISYTEYIPNSKEVVYYNSISNDIRISKSYSAFTLIGAFIIYGLYKGIENSKIRKLEKKQ